MRRGHDVTVLEASDRTGGHVYTVREGFDDGLYGDGGAEHFTNPGTTCIEDTSPSSSCPSPTSPARGHRDADAGKLYRGDAARPGGHFAASA